MAYNLIKRYLGERKPRCKNLKESDVKLLIEGREMVKGWKQYIEELYRDLIPLGKGIQR
jgi:hypothetical protein